MKKAYSLLICLSFLCSTVYSRYSASPPTHLQASPASEAFVTLTRTSMPQSKTFRPIRKRSRPMILTAGRLKQAGQAAERMTSVQVLPIGGLGSIETARRFAGPARAKTSSADRWSPRGGNCLFGASQDLTEIPTEDIDHIEVVRGGISALYGPNAMGGVLNVITRRGSSEKPAADAEYDYGSYGRNIFRGSAGAKIRSRGRIRVRRYAA